jgi:3-oxoadipate enol-lactonase
MSEIDVNGVRTYCEEYGSGPSLVLVHGLGATGRDLWKKHIATLAENFRVVAYDLRGSGRSEVTPGPYTISQLADDLDALVDALGLAPAALMGHSMGGSIVLEQAARHPHRVRAVVAVGAAIDLPEQARAGLAARAETVERDGMGAVAETIATNGMAPSFREAHPEEFQEFISLLAGNDVNGYAAQCRALVEMAITEHLPRIAAPALLVCGELDAVSPPAVNREAAGQIPDARTVEVADCAHIVPWEKPDELQEAARPFLLQHA